MSLNKPAASQPTLAPNQILPVPLQVFPEQRRVHSRPFEFFAQTLGPGVGLLQLSLEMGRVLIDLVLFGS